MPQIRVTMQIAGGAETLVFGDEVTAERLCPTLSIAERSVLGAVGVLRRTAVIREYIGAHMVKSLEAGAELLKTAQPMAAHRHSGARAGHL